MARYTGPKTKIARKFGEPIFGEDKVLQRRNFPPGQHGQNRRRKTSEYGTQLSIAGPGRSPGEGNGDPLQYSCLRIPWTEKPGRLQSTESQRVRHD